MKNNSKENESSVSKAVSEALAGYAAGETHYSERNSNPQFQANGHAPGQILNTWVVLDLVAQRWHWLIIGLVAGAGLFYWLGGHAVKPKFTATGQLLRYEAPGKSEYFKTPPVSSEIFIATIRSPDLLRAVGNKMIPPLPPETLNRLIRIDPESDSDIVKNQLAAREPQQAVELLNLYLTNAVEFTLTNEARQAAVLANDYLQQEVKKLDEDIGALKEQLQKLPIGPLLTNGLAHVGSQINDVSTNLAGSPQPSMLAFSKQAERLQSALAEQNDLLMNYTELHPKVQAKRAQIKELEKQAAQAPPNTSSSVATLAAMPALTGGGVNPDLDIIHIKMLALQDGRVELSRRQLEAKL